MPNKTPYTPAARDVALRALAVAPAPAAAPSGAQTMGATAAGAGVVPHERDAKALFEQLRAAQTPEQHQQILRDMLHLVHAPAPGTEHMKEHTDHFGDEFDRLDRAEQKDAKAAEAKPDPRSTDDEAARAEALRIKKMRTSRLGQ
jgi:hypothetical protein